MLAIKELETGDAFRHWMTIEPAQNGSFIVRAGDTSPALTFGFTNVSDLLDWLVANAQAFAADKVTEKVTELTQDQIRAQVYADKVHIGDPLDRERVRKPNLMSRVGDGSGAGISASTFRTTAADIIAEREARSGVSAAEARDAAKASSEPQRSA